MNLISDTLTKKNILDRVRRLQPDSTRLWGKMTAHQMVCHLSDSFELAMGVRQAADASSFLQRNVIKWIALRAPMKWPHGVPTRPEVDQEVSGTRPLEFAQDAARLLQLIERFSNPVRDFRFARHPMFGAMTEWEWMRWGYLHTDHHIRQFGL